MGAPRRREGIGDLRVRGSDMWVTGLPPARGAVGSRGTARVAGCGRGAPSGAAVAHRQRVGHGDRAEEICHGVDPIKALRVVCLAVSGSVVFADVVGAMIRTCGWRSAR